MADTSKKPLTTIGRKCFITLMALLFLNLLEPSAAVETAAAAQKGEPVALEM
jgi:hypothetical protein